MPSPLTNPPWTLCCWQAWTTPSLSSKTFHYHIPLSWHLHDHHDKARNKKVIIEKKSLPKRQSNEEENKKVDHPETKPFFFLCWYFLVGSYTLATQEPKVGLLISSSTTLAMGKAEPRKNHTFSYSRTCIHKKYCTCPHHKSCTT